MKTILREISEYDYEMSKIMRKEKQTRLEMLSVQKHTYALEQMLLHNCVATVLALELNKLEKRLEVLEKCHS